MCLWQRLWLWATDSEGLWICVSVSACVHLYVPWKRLRVSPWWAVGVCLISLLAPPLLCQIQLVRRDILVFSLILERKSSVFLPSSMMSAVCFSLMPYFRMTKFPSVHSYWLSSLSRVVEYFQISFCTYWDDLVVFGICSINSILLIGCYLNSSSDIRPTFLSWVNFTGSCCIGHFILLDSPCQYFVEAFASILKRRICVLYYKVLYSVKLLLYIVCICVYICMYIFIKGRNSIYSVCRVFVQYW